MLVYAVMALMMAGWFTVSVENNIRGRIRMGNIAVDFIKPVNVFGMYLAEGLMD